MIQIKTYRDLDEAEKTFHIYLYNVARALPFPVEDVFPEGYSFDSKKKTYIRNFDYLPIWQKKGESEEDLKNVSEMIRNYSERLYEYLYSDGKINRSNLRKLLTTPMDNESLESLSILEIMKDVEKKKPLGSTELLEKVFRYNVFTNPNRVCNIYEYVKRLGVEVCPYCNRVFTSTIDTSETTGDGVRKARPQLDHYRNKDHYPFLALSILNLVPSCGVCNQLKGANNDLVLYPFQEGLGTAYRFQTNPSPDNPDLTYLVGNHTDFSVELHQADNTVSEDYKTRVQNSIRLFGLTGFYQSHMEFLSDLFFQRYIFNDEYCRELYMRFPNLFESVKDVKKLLFLRSIEQEEWGRRPLSKLVHDIDLEIEEMQKSPFS